MGHSGVTLKNIEDHRLQGLITVCGGAPPDTDGPRKSTGDLIALNYETVSDEVLVELYIKNRDPHAFTQIIQRHRDTILGFAIKMTGNPSDAEDIVQDISLILVKKLDTFKGNSKFSTWLYKVTLNTCYLALNKSKRRKEHELSANSLYDSASGSPAQSPKWAENPGRILLYRESAEVVRDAVNALSERNRDILRLRYIDGFSTAQVGEITGISISAVKSRVLRSRLFIRDRVASYFQDNC